MQDQEAKIFTVKVFEPYHIDYRTILEVPATSLKEAVDMVAKKHQDGDAWPKEWDAVGEYLTDEAEVVENIDGNGGWEVIDEDFTDELSMKADTSKQRAFMFSGMGQAGSPLYVKPVDQPCIPHIGYTVFGVLVAEPATDSEVSDAAPKSVMLSTTRGWPCPGDTFWMGDVKYRVLWAFKNPQ